MIRDGGCILYVVLVFYGSGSGMVLYAVLCMVWYGRECHRYGNYGGKVLLRPGFVKTSSDGPWLGPGVELLVPVLLLVLL